MQSPMHTPLTGCGSCQLFEQGFGFLKISRVKALGEPAIERRQQLIGGGPLTLLLPQPTQTHRGAQFQRFRLLAVSYSESLVKTHLSRSVRGRGAKAWSREVIPETWDSDLKE